ncbi:hypothetical protein [Nostoc sp.]|uniref:hypothetical protein n=1 Tax=Nostoc sp. TaxID=1180 RepID=UPI002FF8A601
MFLLNRVGAQAFAPVRFDRRGKAIAKICLNHWRYELYSDRIDRCIVQVSYF